jgi:hypothetical protein
MSQNFNRRIDRLEHRRAGRILMRHGLDYSCSECEAVNRNTNGEMD